MPGNGNGRKLIAPAVYEHFKEAVYVQFKEMNKSCRTIINRTDTQELIQ